MEKVDLIPLCRKSLIAYCVAQWQGYQAAPHHRMIANALERISEGSLKRLIINTAPRHGKSMLTSEFFPAWYFGHHPDHQVIHASYSQDMVDGFGRRVRNQLRDELYNAVFPGTVLSDDSQAANKFNTTANGVYLAVGVSGSATGKGAHLMLIDDPVKDRAEADSELMRKQLRDWYTSVAYTRLMKGGAIVVIQCMTGDTPVMMADNTERPLSTIRPGDMVRSWDAGVSVTRRVLNATSQGEDDILEIRTGSSRVRCNARHPFLTDRGWVKAGELTTKDRLVTASRLGGIGERLKGAAAWLLGFMFGDGWVTTRDTVQKGYKGRTYPRRGFVSCVATSLDKVCNEKIWRHFEAVFGFRPKVGKFGYARTDIAAVGKWFVDRGITNSAHTKRLPEWLFAETEENRLAFLCGYNEADGCRVSKGPNTGRWSHASCSPSLMLDIRRLARGVGYRVTNMFVAHSMIQAPNSPVPILSTVANVQWVPTREEGDFCSQRVRSIRAAGREEVFDIQVEGTECFIADGVVSHNTRWHEDDLAGWLLRDHGHENWEILNLPAIMDEGLPTERALWPDAFPMERLLQIRETLSVEKPRDWEALYMQRPRAGTGAEFKRHWIAHYSSVLHASMFKIMLVDPASSKREENDHTSIWIVGLGEDENYYVLDMVRDRLNLTERADTVFRLHRKWKPGQVRYEQYGMQADIEHIRAEMDKRSYRFVIHEVGGATKKEDRIRRLIPLFERGCIWLPHMLSYTTMAGKTLDLVHHFIEDEFLAFPVARHDDMLDSLSRLAEPKLDTPWPSKRNNVGPVMEFGVLDEVCGY